MGAVYKARQRGLDRLVALKILSPQISDDPAFAERFAREARALARLSHPNVVTVFDLGQSGPLYYFLMEFVDGVNLRQLIESHRLTPREAIGLMPQICEGLEYAHAEGIVHRDIKPENILLDQKGRVKIADFGLSKLLEPSPQAEQLTQADHVLGTMHYMSPEQFENPLAVDHRADIYSLGVVLYEMLTGELPLGRFELPSQKAAVDARLDELVLHTLERNPERRFQQVSEVRVQLETIAGVSSRISPEVSRKLGYEYRSRATLFGWPLLHIATGVDPTTGRRRSAKGIIAVGTAPRGIIAFGDVAVGVVACGIFCYGPIAIGIVSVGICRRGHFGGGIGPGDGRSGAGTGGHRRGGLRLLCQRRNCLGISRARARRLRSAGRAVLQSLAHEVHALGILGVTDLHAGVSGAWTRSRPDGETLRTPCQKGASAPLKRNGDEPWNGDFEVKRVCQFRHAGHRRPLYFPRRRSKQSFRAGNPRMDTNPHQSKTVGRARADSSRAFPTVTFPADVGLLWR